MRVPRLLCVSLLAVAPCATLADLPRRIPVEDLFSNPVIASPVISADGSTMAYLQSQGDLLVVLSRPVSGGQPKPLGKFENPAVRPRWLRWANDRRLLISAQARSQSSVHVAGRETRLFGVDADGGDMAWLGRDWPVFGQLSHAIAYQDQIIHMTPDDPGAVLLSYRPPYETSPSGMRMDVATGRVKRVQDAKAGVHSWHADAKGQIRAGEGAVANHYQLWARATAEADFELVIDFEQFAEDGPEFAGFHVDP